MLFKIDCKKFVFFVFVVFSYSWGIAQQVDYEKYGIDRKGHLPKGLKVGAQAPDFKGIGQYGDSIHLRTLLKKGPVVLIFYRGVWCPVCIRYLSNLQDSLSYLEKRGCTVLAVTPEISESIAKTSEKTAADFILLADKDEEIMRSYDVWFDVTPYYQTKVRVGRLTDVAANNGKDRARLPIPATFIIDQKGIILYKHFDLNYKKRASVREIIEHLP